MKIIKPQIEIEKINGLRILKNIERAGRTCYKSEANITDDSAKKFVRGLIKRGHFSVVEHEKISVRIICDRGITHEIVRHRLASYSQESTRYVNYKDGICVIKPSFWSKEEEFKSSLNKFKIWEDAMRDAEKWYRLLIDAGAKPEEARAVLPNSLKTEIVVTMNLREWRHFFHLRCSKYAHPQIREVSMMILSAFQKEIPVVFDDFNIIQDKMIAHTDIIPAS